MGEEGEGRGREFPFADKFSRVRKGSEFSN